MTTSPLSAVLAALAVLLASGPALAAHCRADAPFVYVWGEDDFARSERAYYYSNVFDSRGASQADLVAIFAERARDQHGASPHSRPSRCFETRRDAQSDRARRISMQSGRGARHFDVRW